MKPDSFDMLKNASYLMSFVLHVISELKVFSVSFCKLICHLKNQTEKARHQLPSGWHTAESRCFQTGSMKRCLGPQGMLTYSKTCDLHKIKDVLRAAVNHYSLMPIFAQTTYNEQQIIALILRYSLFLPLKALKLPADVAATFQHTSNNKYGEFFITKHTTLSYCS
ncbi:hypothetical protein D917_04056 [Trichinella nativa]|uniref:Uncharacterized protein n=1 Tax=Trichinella nativa TaxID=6335 RepID=A0A1Y3E9D0_9BILA|nr:hypothetical protein D917_04056 [Trichinella nativa]